MSIILMKEHGNLVDILYTIKGLLTSLVSCYIYIFLCCETRRVRISIEIEALRILNQSIHLQDECIGIQMQKEQKKLFCLKTNAIMKVHKTTTITLCVHQN